MLVSPRMNELLRNEDAKQYQRQLKFFTKEFNKQLSISLYVLYYILFIYDESLIRFALQCFLHIFLSHMIDELNVESDVLPGVTPTNTLTRIFNPANNNTATVGNNRDSDGLINEEVQGLFEDWQPGEKSEFASRVVTVFLTPWVFIILYQIAFCLDDTYDGMVYDFSGKLSEQIRRTAYKDSYLKTGDLWTVSKAFTMGSIMTNWIGDFRCRSKVWKLVGILTLDFIIVSIQIIALINNYGIGLKVIHRFDADSDHADGVEDERTFNGLQGQLVLMRINPLKALRDLIMASQT
ncbi:hypothetical protein CANINC_001144 [Pichia inconspicua]|uniref:Uncharacterized protein n=1 Tax=Pichia inconspicua TaxID=52247 RepID=A0A4T0X605_9ASCO|nr:hypothetical protein CANINC_001144 [[Candida] inconspicua]